MNMTTAFAALCLTLASAAFAQDPAKPPPPAKQPETKPDQAELERQFEKAMTGATLVGRFTVEGRGDAGREPREERYEISKVTKMNGDYWMFVARVQYGNKDVTVPMALQVKWAGVTPVITLTDFPIPRLGTYTARVMIFRDHYAGYWSGGDHGGNLWGRVERTAPAASPAPPAPDAPAPRN